MKEQGFFDSDHAKDPKKVEYIVVRALHEEENVDERFI